MDSVYPTPLGLLALVRATLSPPCGVVLLCRRPATLCRLLSSQLFPCAGEEDGVHYHFVDKDEMEKDIKAGMFLEHAYVHGNIYGTSFEAVESVSKASKVCILDIDVQGVKTCQSVGFNADKYVFIAPPDIKALETRLRGRGTETEDRIQKRLHNAVGELEDAKSMSWDAYIVNDDISVAYEKLREVAREGRQACAESRAAATAMTAVA